MWELVLTRFDRVLGIVSKVAAGLGALAGALIMVIMAYDVAVRLTGGGSVPGAVQLVESLIVGAVFLSLPLAERTRTHVRVQLVTSVMPPVARRFARTIGHGTAAVFIAWSAYASTERALLAFERSEYTMGIITFPTWPGRAVVALGMCLLTFELVLSTRAAWTEGRASMPERRELPTPAPDDDSVGLEVK